MKKYKLLIPLIAVFLVFSGVMYSQEQSGEVIGTVVLEDGSAIPGVSVEIKGPKLIGTKASVTNENGVYRLMGIPTGIYQVTFTLEGFKTIKRKGIRVDLGKTFKLDAIMQTGEIREEVVVSGQIPVVDVRKSASAVSIPKESFTRLPRSTRTFMSVATQAAGVNYEREMDPLMATEGSFDAETQTAISFDGASSAENTFFVDGMDTTTMEKGVSGNNVQTDFIEEVQVKSSGYAAEYGGSMGGVISVITRSGGNEFQGDLIMYYDSDWLRGNPRDILQLNPIDSTQAEYSDYLVDKWNRIEPGISLGGYILKDRLWFFASFMPQIRTRTREGVFIGSPEHDGEEFTFKDIRYNGSAKLTAAIGKNLRVSVSGSMNNRIRQNQLPRQDGASGYSDTIITGWEGYERTEPSVTLAGSLDYSLGNSAFLTVSGGYFRYNDYFTGEKNPPEPRLRMAQSNYDVPGMPVDLQRPRFWYNVTWDSLKEDTKDIHRRMSAKTDLTLYFNAGGEHVVKMGFGWNQLYADLLRDAINTEYWYFYWAQPNGSYSVYTLADGTVVDTPLGYARALGPYGTIGELRSNRFSLYLQDSWTIGDKLTVNYGVRMEKEDLPSLDESRPAAFSFDFFDKIAPRIGFSYDMKGDGTNKLFGSFGLYHDVMKVEMAVGTFGGDLWHDSWYAIGTVNWPEYANYQGWSFTGSNDAILGGQFLEHINHRVISWDSVQPDMKPYTKLEMSIGYQRKINDNLAFTARFLHHRMLQVVEDIGVEIGGSEHYYYGNPGSDWSQQIYDAAGARGDMPPGRVCPKPKREYYSVQLSLDKKFSNNWMGGVAFTWSSLKGIFSGLASSDEHGRQSPMVNRYWDYWFLHYDSQMNLADGPLPTDRPLDLKVYGAYTFDWGLTLGFNSYIKSGTPISTEFMLNNQQGYYPYGRANEGRTPMLWQMDLYAEYNVQLGKNFNLNLNANITNLTNNKIAQRIYNRLYDDEVNMDQNEIAAGFDALTVLGELGLPTDPRYLWKHHFTESLAVRLGAKLSF